MASAKTTQAVETFPEGFTYPFKPVVMEERIDDGLALLAAMTGASLATLREEAFRLGVPRNGPAWIGQETLTKMALPLGLVIGEWATVTSIDALPDVALLQVDAVDDYGRFALFTHFRGTDAYPSFNVLLDPNGWLDEKYRLTRSWSHLRVTFPLWYLPVTQKPAAKGK